jgi:TrpR-related protein YerC/YecD
MVKFPKISKLTQKEKDELLVDFCEALSKIQNSAEAASFLKDLLSSPEIEMLAKRLKIARLLIDGNNNIEVAQMVGVSRTTVSRVAIWLRTSGEGYRMISKRIPKAKELSEKDRINQAFKRRYAKYYWPELLWDTFMKDLSWRKKSKIKELLQSSMDKEELFEQISQSYRSR